VRLLWLLPKAAPALLRHLTAYVELAALDFAQFQRDIAASIVAFAVLAVSLFFAVLMGCAAVIALTWDTPHRVSAIAWMGGGFVVIAIVAAIYRSKAASDQASIFTSLRREWREDSVMWERILSDEEERQ